MNKSATGPTRISVIAGSLAVMLVAGLLLAACSNPLASELSTPLPPEYLPTAAALTLAALEVNRATPTQPAKMAVSPTIELTKVVGASPTVLATTPALPTATPSPEFEPDHLFADTDTHPNTCSRGTGFGSGHSASWGYQYPCAANPGCTHPDLPIRRVIEGYICSGCVAAPDLWLRKSSSDRVVWRRWTSASTRCAHLQ